MNNTEKKRERFGRYLKVRREELGILVKDMSSLLGYTSSNMVTIIEKGRTVIPLGKFEQFASQYNLDATDKLFAISVMHESAFDVFCDIVGSIGPAFAGKAKPEVLEQLNLDFENRLKRYKVA